MTGNNAQFEVEIEADEIEVLEGHDYLEIQYPEGAQHSSDDCNAINSTAILH